jgi:hypothetical protein
MIFMNVYSYEGPVMRFETCVHDKWKGTTQAVSEAKAKNNLAFRFKQEFGLVPNTKITLPGKLMTAQ